MNLGFGYSTFFKLRSSNSRSFLKKFIKCVIDSVAIIELLTSDIYNNGLSKNVPNTTYINR